MQLHFLIVKLVITNSEGKLGDGKCLSLKLVILVTTVPYNSFVKDGILPSYMVVCTSSPSIQNRMYN